MNLTQVIKKLQSCISSIHLFSSAAQNVLCSETFLLICTVCILYTKVSNKKQQALFVLLWWHTFYKERKKLIFNYIDGKSTATYKKQMLIVAKWLGQPGKENKEKTTEVITYALWNALTNLNLTIPIWNHMNGLFLNRSFNPCLWNGFAPQTLWERIQASWFDNII